MTLPRCHRCGDVLASSLEATCATCVAELRQEIVRYAEFFRASVALETARGDAADGDDARHGA